MKNVFVTHPLPASAGPETRALDAGLLIDPATGAIAPNVSMSVNNVLMPGDGAFSADGVADLADLPYLYARWTNPTVRQLEQRLAGLEGAEDALATATGMAAIAGTLFTFLKAGDHLVVSDVCYAGAVELTQRVLPDFGIEVTPVNMARLDLVEAAMRPNTRLVHCESPVNPILRIVDLESLAAIAHRHGALISVDSTFATPVATRPLALGVDLVIHSLTKFINGHGDVLGGAVIGRKELIARIRGRAGVYLGASLSAQSAWLIMRGIDTLYPRLRMASDSALAVARFLEGHPEVERVIYPGLGSHPQTRSRQTPDGCVRRHDRFPHAQPESRRRAAGDKAACRPLCLFARSPAQPRGAARHRGDDDLDLPPDRRRPHRLSRLCRRRALPPVDRPRDTSRYHRRS
jgi:methionine-gamma-lyase